jgi:glycosyltransferase involved in cell wall biosynthesis
MKKVLMVIPFDNIYPPMNGGMLRCFNLLNQLCRHFEVTALMHQDKDSFMQSSAAFPGIKKCNLLSTKNNIKTRDLFSLLPGKYANALRYRYQVGSLFGAADGNFLLLYPQMKIFLQQNRVDFVILEDMTILNLSRLVKKYQPGVPVIYDAYNVNSTLAKAAFEKNEISQKDVDLIQQAETTLYKKADRLFTCSENDLLVLCRMNQDKITGTVVPNGVVMPAENAAAVNAGDKVPHDILFCGSMGYFPNREGLIWFLKNVFQLVVDAIPDARLIIVGKGDPGEELALLLQHPSIVNHGMVDSVDIYYRRVAIAIVPLLSGSGTRLKLMEAMAYKAAVVATSIGAEGINYTNGKDILIADEPAVFAKSIIQLLNHPALANNIADAAFSFVQNRYDWNIIGKNMAVYLNDLKN